MSKKPTRYRVAEMREYLRFPDGTLVEKGKLIPKDVEVEDWLVDLGWVVED
jgi:hypothetical protein